MRKVILVGIIICTVCISNTAISQEVKVPKFSERANINQEKEKKTYDLEAEYDYKVYNREGKTILSGHARWIDITALKAGTYFVIFENNKKQIVIK